jgi:pimeloyl-ACP methyl ester carboxylesterase
VHPPNAFWLKFFVSNKINVMAWNYRNYGRSEGNPNPYSSYHDSEAVLKFLVEDLCITGKIGCFGRSLGGTMATHLAKNYP